MSELFLMKLNVGDVIKMKTNESEHYIKYARKYLIIKSRDKWLVLPFPVNV